MKYFALTAAKGQDPERSCALIDAPNLKDAALRAQRLRDEGFLSFVKPGSTYHIRSASRRETDLLQRFLSACGGAETKIHMQGDFDNLLSRRQSLLHSFFIGLYLAPDKIKKIANGNSSEGDTPPDTYATGGSGGVENSPPSSQTKTGSAEQSNPATGTNMIDTQQERKTDSESTQQTTLAALLSGSGDSSQDDHHVDLGDDQIIGD